jgi:hypothetical protein
MSDGELEKLIDEAGRSAVFARARALGWASGDAPPKWVWQQIAADVKAGRPSGAPPQRLDEALLGFKLW